MPTKTIERVKIPKSKNEWDENDLKLLQSNTKAMNILYCALDPNKFNRIFTCEFVKEIWDKLEGTHEGTNQVKKSKINILVRSYEILRMLY